MHQNTIRRIRTGFVGLVVQFNILHATVSQLWEKLSVLVIKSVYEMLWRREVMG